MIGPEAENKIYTQSFRRSQKGHAIWPKAYSKYLQPGCCGYVDGYGNFVKMVQLTDPAAINNLSLDPLDGIEIVDDGGGTFWDAKTLNQIVAAAVNLDAQAL
ncbi:hypothetical protein N7481_001152 [Penicillium waksmanii]|uniref:uncharacterized protein n=1 Tax=Penicillium waksmanii TaxID=69791 RepID=UPI0025497C47|nr:uncharacterized protein N7481_001152 [Penicillium waksmanii]KAJ6000743.1 hypothetical protein N7481_001152 [Penicillium waksmanii]